jgi:predicted ATP-dependent serine protease
VLEHGVQSSSASYSSSWPSSKLSFLDTTKSKLIVRFVEDRSYKLLIVDSIMNLFRESASRKRVIASANV